MIKRKKMMGLMILIAGILILAATFFVDVQAFQTGLMSGGGAALLVMGIAQIIKMRRLERRPEAAADFEAAFTDERTAFIAGRAGRMAMFIAIYAEIAAGLIASFAFDSDLGCMVLCLTAGFQGLLYYVLVLVYNRAW